MRKGEALPRANLPATTPATRSSASFGSGRASLTERSCDSRAGAPWGGRVGAVQRGSAWHYLCSSSSQLDKKGGVFSPLVEVATSAWRH